MLPWLQMSTITFQQNIIVDRIECGDGVEVYVSLDLARINVGCELIIDGYDCSLGRIKC